jgi:hypothetical protein
MKKTMLSLMVVLFALLFSVSAFAANALTESVTKATVGTVITSSSAEVFKIVILDNDANTSVTRAVHFYNNTSIQVSSHPSTGYMFSVTATVGTYFPKEVFTGVVSNNWGGPIFNGITFSSGVCVSPTANAAPLSHPTIILQYQ